MTLNPMMDYFINENQLDHWVEAAENIKEGFGIDEALGYLIGEKFHGLVQDGFSLKVNCCRIALNAPF